MVVIKPSEIAKKKFSERFSYGTKTEKDALVRVKKHLDATAHLIDKRKDGDLYCPKYKILLEVKDGREAKFNVFVEHYFKYGKNGKWQKSGILATKSYAWIYSCRDKYVVIKTPVLVELVEELDIKSHYMGERDGLPEWRKGKTPLIDDLIYVASFVWD